jgi:hypothetical protein
MNLITEEIKLLLATDNMGNTTMNVAADWDILPILHELSGAPRNFVWEGGSTNSVEDGGQRERGSGGGSPQVRGSGSSCNLVHEI